jgi:DNA-binding NarL/FixJ family response regulator
MPYYTARESAPLYVQIGRPTMAPAPTIRILLADDHHLVRSGIRALLERLPGVSVVAEASDGHEALGLIESLSPDVVLADIAMPGVNGLTLAARVTAAWPQVRVVILSMHHSDAYVSEALRAGASGYLLKDTNLGELELAIKSVVSGGKYLTPAVSKQMVDAFLAPSSRAGQAQPMLTTRQREVLQAIAEGHGTKAIASKLNISVKTVETHRAEIMRRLNIHDVAGLVRYAIQTGIASTD